MAKWFLRRLLTLLVLATSHACVLQTNKDMVTAGSTPEVELLCRQDITHEINKLSSIRIVKQGPFATKITFAQVRAGSDNHPTGEDDVRVTAEINEDQAKSSFLKIKWEVASPNTAGAYSCEVGGLDSNDNYVVLHAEPIIIKETFLTVDDVNKLILSVTSAYEKKQQALELEISQLKTFISDELSAKGRQISDVDDKLASEISLINERVKSNYATKTEVSTHIVRLRNFTLDEIMSKKSQTPCQNISDEFNSTIFHVRDDMFGKIDYVEKTIDFIEAQIDNITDHFTEQVQKMRLNVDLCCPNVFPTKDTPNDTDRPTSGMSISPAAKISTPPTAPTAVQISRFRWPTGKYTMVKPGQGGCPKSYDGDTVFFTLRYTLASSVDNLDSLYKVYLRSGYKTSTLQFCYRSTDDSVGIKWPKGSYCIGKSQSSCPEDFSKGEIVHNIMKEIYDEKKKQVGAFKQFYCCRSDGRADAPIALPTRDQFYMYRYKGKCQKVQDMDVKQDAIIMWKDIGISSPFTSKWTSPDSNSRGNMILCHYLRRS